MNLTVSVVIPAYNSGGYLARTLDSVIAQSRPADEIIVIDDGSTDETGEVAAKYGDQIKYIYQENAGAAAARNTGIENASGEWIAFLDGDDEWLEDYLKEQTDLLKCNSDLVWCAGNFYNCDCVNNHSKRLQDPGKGKELLAGGDFFDDYFQAYINAAAGWTGSMIIKRSVLKEAGMFTKGQPMANDIDMWWRVAYRYPKIGYNPKPLVIYHSHIENSISKKHKSPDILSDLIKKHLDIARSLGACEIFIPCAGHMIKYWNYVYLFDERVSSIRKINKRFSDILNFRYRFIMGLLTICPGLTSLMKPVIDRLSGRIGIRR